jgi:carbon-monoxide dehydrogenase medium subunit
MRARKAEAVLEGKPLSAPLIEAAADAAMMECSPIDDVRASAGYRRNMIKVLTRRLLTRALDHIQEVARR